MNAISAPLDDAAMVALGQLFETISITDNRVIEESRRIHAAVQECLPQLRKHIDVLLADHQKLKTSLIETMSQLNQVGLSGKALEGAVAHRLGLVTSLREESRKRVLAANRAIF